METPGQGHRKVISWHSPERKPIAQFMGPNSIPGYPWDNPIAALPALHVVPAKAEFRLFVWLCVDHGKAQYYSTLCKDKDEVWAVLNGWRDDPEGTMMEVFGWPGLKAAPKAGLDLSQLEL
jgi:hypothetical protein